MMDNNTEEASFADMSKGAQPVYLQRSVSAPAIAEHVSEAVLPPFALEQTDMSGDAFPSRLNPRLPRLGGEDFSPLPSSLFVEPPPSSLGLLDENAVGGAVGGGGWGRVDLIQADFPSTPSSIFRKHPQPEADGDAQVPSQGAGEGVNSPSRHHLSSSRLPQIMSANDEALEEATKSFQKLYGSNEAPMASVPPSNPLYFLPQGGGVGGGLGGGKPLPATPMSGETDLSFSLT
eukprot:gene38651-46986_t